MFKKLAEQLVEISFQIPDSEKQQAKEILEELQKTKGQLNSGKELLELTKPFEANQTVSSKALAEKRGVLNRYKQQVLETFNLVKKQAFSAVTKMKFFETDHNIAEQISSLEEAMKKIETKVEKFCEVLDDYENQDFRDQIIASTKESIEACEATEKLIEERIENHFRENILTNSWAESASALAQKTIAPNMPMLARLYQERMDAIQNAGLNLAKRPQPLSPAQTPSISYSGDSRPANYSE